MDDVGRSILWLSLAILFGLIAAVFSAANEAYDDAGVSRLRRLYEEEDDQKAGKLLHLQSKVQPYALRINLGCAFSLLLSAAFLLAGLMGFTTVWLHILIGMATGSLLILLLCVALPRVLAESDPTGYVLRFCALRCVSI
jgi:CBS domain containing-hemolysin-like protein